MAIKEKTMRTQFTPSSLILRSNEFNNNDNGSRLEIVNNFGMTACRSYHYLFQRDNIFIPNQFREWRATANYGGVNYDSISLQDFDRLGKNEVYLNVYHASERGYDRAYFMNDNYNDGTSFLLNLVLTLDYRDFISIRMNGDTIEGYFHRESFYEDCDNEILDGRFKVVNGRVIVTGCFPEHRETITGFIAEHLNKLDNGVYQRVF